MDTIRKETAAEISRTREDMMSLQEQIMKTREKLKNLEAALKKAEGSVDQVKKPVRPDNTN